MLLKAFHILSADAMQNVPIWKGKDDMYGGEPTILPATPLVRAAVICNWTVEAHLPEGVEQLIV